MVTIFKQVLARPYLPTLGWAFIILVLTLVPPQALPEVPQWNLISFHSLAHLFVFMIWAFLLLFGFTRSGNHRATFWVTLLLAVGYGALIELLQGLMRLGRQADIVDIVYNTIGAIIGILLFYLIRKTFKFR